MTCTYSKNPGVSHCPLSSHLPNRKSAASSKRPSTACIWPERNFSHWDPANPTVIAVLGKKITKTVAAFGLQALYWSGEQSPSRLHAIVIASEFQPLTRGDLLGSPASTPTLARIAVVATPRGTCPISRKIVSRSSDIDPLSQPEVTR